MIPKLQRMDGPSHNSFITGIEPGVVVPVNDDKNNLVLICELLHQINDKLEFQNELLGEIGK